MASLPSHDIAHHATVRPSSKRSRAKQSASLPHVVQFYDKESVLLETLVEFAGSAIKANDSAVIVATKPHRDKLAQLLKATRVDLESAIAEGRFVAVDAADTLALFCQNGLVDGPRFKQVVGELLDKAAAAARGKQRRLAVFGEMVGLLWKQRNHAGVVRLEQLWNELAMTRTFTLLCAYPMNGFRRQEHQKMFLQICAQHAQVMPAESYLELAGPSAQLRGIAELQQKAQALEFEVRLNRERILLLQDAGNSGIWEMDFGDEAIVLSSRAQRMLGVQMARMSLDSLLNLMRYSGDRDNFRAALTGASTGRKEFTTVFRIARGGEARLLSARGKVFYNAGQPLVLGVLADVTPRKRR